MDVDAVLKALYQERELLSQAIVTLENLVRGKKRRGRPPRWLRSPPSASSKTGSPSSKTGSRTKPPEYRVALVCR